MDGPSSTVTKQSTPIVFPRTCRAGPIRLRQEGGLSARGGFAVSMVAGDTAAGAPATTRFVPPSLIWCAALQQVGAETQACG